MNSDGVNLSVSTTTGEDLFLFCKCQREKRVEVLREIGRYSKEGIESGGGDKCILCVVEANARKLLV